MAYNIIECSNEVDFGAKAKLAFCTAIRGLNGLPNVILPTGNTPAPFFQALKDSKVPITPFQYLQLDEYLGLPEDDEILFKNWLDRDVLSPLGITHRMAFNSAADPASEIQRIRDWYNHFRRVDVAVLGIGKNGHVGFNEPGSAFNSRARVAEMSDETWEANNKYWDREVPKKIITLGITELKLASTTLLLARGEEKADILYEAFYGEMTTEIPASYLQLQRNVVIIADKNALGRFPK